MTPSRLNGNDGPSTGEINDKRISLVREQCQQYAEMAYWKTLIPTGHFWSYGKADGIHYCITPKVGCTYWKRIMRYLNKDYNGKANISKPSDIDRMFVHYGALSRTQVTSFKEHFTMQLFSGGKAFMFSRDPYSRLWSAYIDKFLLPDFWRSFAIRAVKLARPNATVDEILCPKDVTFREYLAYIMNKTNGWNEHWEPIHRICSPCHVKFDVIGKQETFSADSTFILNRYGLQNLTETADSNWRVREEVLMLVSYNFLLEPHIRKGCFEKQEVASKIWKAFQYNGYIHKDTEFQKDLLNLTAFIQDPITEFSNLVFKTIENQVIKGVSLRSQKREMMVEAYRSVPIELLQELQNVYKYDFELFGYELRPKDIYDSKT